MRPTEGGAHTDSTAAAEAVAAVAVAAAAPRVSATTPRLAAPGRYMGAALLLSTSSSRHLVE